VAYPRRNRRPLPIVTTPEDLVITRFLHVAALIAAAFAGATCDGWDPPPEPVDCSPEGEDSFFEQRIAPLLEEERPQSCNQCHLSGIDLGMWVKESPCKTMACMIDEGVVDLDDPESSLLLAWIDRAAPESEGITAGVLVEERQGVLEWIERTATCGLCDAGADPCGHEDKEPAVVGDCEVWEGDNATFAFDDPGDCSDKTLEGLFQASFFPFRRRCWPCHFENYPDSVKDAPKWIAVGPCELASLSTYRNVAELGYIDVEEPTQSLWILKPLDEAIGGVEHGGGPKFHEFDELGVPQMLYFSERYAACQKP
jgi:hypothetical protein